MDAVAFRYWVWDFVERTVNAGDRLGTHVFRLIGDQPAEPEPLPTSELLAVLDQELTNPNIEALGCVIPVHSWLFCDVRLDGAYVAVVAVGTGIQQRVRVTSRVPM